MGIAEDLKHQAARIAKTWATGQAAYDACMYVRRECPCGTVERMHVLSQLCGECRRKRRAEQNRESQRRRRSREAMQRRLKAGVMVLETHDDAVYAVSSPVPCQLCQRPFRPRRSTGRFCSSRCRVAWNRA
jgi:protein-arginine kinase activator protein McsA